MHGEANAVPVSMSMRWLLFITCKYAFCAHSPTTGGMLSSSRDDTTSCKMMCDVTHHSTCSHQAALPIRILCVLISFHKPY